METHQFRMRISNEMHVILKRVALDSGMTMKELFIEMFESWIADHMDNGSPKSDFTIWAIQAYWKKRNCK